MNFYAHTHPDHPHDGSKWEPLFTPYGSDPDTLCQREHCGKCRKLLSHHGHLNKVAFWTAQFAAGMFPSGPACEAAYPWGYLTGLWHDLGKFAPEWQTYLASKADPHSQTT